MMRLVRTTLPLGLAICLLGDCMPAPRLTARWYLNYGPERMVAPASGEAPRPAGKDAPAPDLVVLDPAERVDDMYIAVVNMGRPIAIDKLTLDNGAVLLDKDQTLAHDRLLIRAVNAFPAEKANERSCLIPSHLRVRVIAKRRYWASIRITGTMPTALPSEWIDSCTESADPAPLAAK